jgi:hypothetical protein
MVKILKEKSSPKWRLINVETMQNIGDYRFLSEIAKEIDVPKQDVIYLVAISTIGRRFLHKKMKELSSKYIVCKISDFNV